MEMENVEITLVGCDDYTTFNLTVNNDELNFLKVLSEKSKEVSTYGCMPTLEYKIITE